MNNRTIFIICVTLLLAMLVGATVALFAPIVLEKDERVLFISGRDGHDTTKLILAVVIHESIYNREFTVGFTSVCDAGTDYDDVAIIVDANIYEECYPTLIEDGVGFNVLVVNDGQSSAVDRFNTILRSSQTLTVNAIAVVTTGGGYQYEVGQALLDWKIDNPEGSVSFYTSCDEIPYNSYDLLVADSSFQHECAGHDINIYYPMLHEVEEELNFILSQ